MALASRREARERALSILYEAEIVGTTAAQALAGQAVPPDPFVTTLVTGVDGHQDALDAVIAAASVGWTIERMPVIDRLILRLAAFELHHLEEVPVATVITEAVELAKQYSTDSSGRFVNGVLGAVARQARPG